MFSPLRRLWLSTNFILFGLLLVFHELEFKKSLAKLARLLWRPSDTGSSSVSIGKLNSIVREYRDNQNLRQENRGKWCIVTGSNSGIGAETVKVLAREGYKVIMACRSERRAMEAMEQVQDYLKDMRQGIVADDADDPSTRCEQMGDVRYMHLDLCSLDSVRSFSQRIIQEDIPVNLLICNAGMMGVSFDLTPDNVERQFQVNYLANVLLVESLLEHLTKNSPNARIIIVSSEAHRPGKSSTVLQYADNVTGWTHVRDPDQLKLLTDEERRALTRNLSKHHDRTYSYAHSKLCQFLYYYELHRNLQQSRKTSPNLYIIHPGVVYTSIGNGLWFPINHLYAVALKGIAKTPLEGCACTITCALSSKVESGRYYVDGELAQSSTPDSYDTVVGKALFNRTRMILQRFLKR